MSGGSPKASVVGTFTLKQCSRVYHNTPFSFRNLKLKPPSRGLPLRHLDSRAFGAQLLVPFKNPKYLCENITKFPSSEKTLVQILDQFQMKLSK